jgi:hypothetical protein
VSASGPRATRLVACPASLRKHRTASRCSGARRASSELLPALLRVKLSLGRDAAAAAERALRRNLPRLLAHRRAEWLSTVTAAVWNELLSHRVIASPSPREALHAAYRPRKRLVREGGPQELQSEPGASSPWQCRRNAQQLRAWFGRRVPGRTGAVSDERQRCSCVHAPVDVVAVVGAGEAAWVEGPVGVPAVDELGGAGRAGDGGEFVYEVGAAAGAGAAADL